MRHHYTAEARGLVGELRARVVRIHTTQMTATIKGRLHLAKPGDLVSLHGFVAHGKTAICGYLGTKPQRFPVDDLEPTDLHNRFLNDPPEEFQVLRAIFKTGHPSENRVIRAGDRLALALARRIRLLDPEWSHELAVFYRRSGTKFTNWLPACDVAIGSLVVDQSNMSDCSCPVKQLLSFEGCTCGYAASQKREDPSPIC